MTIASHLTLWTSLALLTVADTGSLIADDVFPGTDWRQFRGPGASGVSDGHPLPTAWDVKSGDELAWQAPIPGLGHAGPIVTGGKIFVVTAVSGRDNAGVKVGIYGNIESVNDNSQHAWRLLCLERDSGKVAWDRCLHRGVPRIKRHTKATHANATPVTDGRRIVVSLGSEGLYCYDLDGRRLWKQDLGLLDSGYYKVPAAQWGFGSSPILYGDSVIVQCDVQQGSYLAAFALDDGRQLWGIPRDEVPTWSTPVLWQGKHPAQLVVAGYRHSGGYDPATGRELWRLSGGGDIPVCTPVPAGDLVILSSAHGSIRPLRAIRATARGDITPKATDKPTEHIAWSLPRDGIYMQTPILYGGLLYACRLNGVLSCYEPETGKRIYRSRLDGGIGFTASPVAGDGKLYFTSEDGRIYVVAAGRTFRLLETNRIGQQCMATPAISGGLLLVRGQDHLFAIGTPCSPPRSTTAARSPATRRPVRKLESPVP
ncbi:MAG: PQQ-binding-like beta-propeller repeat protein [Planctomycetaceae bacterium]